MTESEFWNRVVGATVWIVCAMLGLCALFMIGISGTIMLIWMSAMRTEHWIYAIPLGGMWAWLTLQFRKIAREKGF